MLILFTIFSRGYQYKDILDVLATYHNIEISERTLHRRLRMHGLSRRKPEFDVDTIITEIEGVLDGPIALRVTGMYGIASS